MINIDCVTFGPKCNEKSNWYLNFKLLLEVNENNSNEQTNQQPNLWLKHKQRAYKIYIKMKDMLSHPVHFDHSH